MRKFIKNIPIVGSTLKRAYRSLNPPTPFPGSEQYWIDRYKKGGNSGDGSYSKLAEFKAEIINHFVEENNITSVMEFGCGDGNQLTLAKYKRYIGFDVSPEAIKLCRSLFEKDASKEFFLLKDYAGQKAELTMSLDVIYHLIEDEVFHSYMNKLFDSSSRFTIIYASNKEENSSDGASHVKHRKFTDWIEKYRADWMLISHIPNRYPWKGDTQTGSFSDFYVFKKAKQWYGRNA